eukprot:623439-Hanusia_phi.AAC.1
MAQSCRRQLAPPRIPRRALPLPRPAPTVLLDAAFSPGSGSAEGRDRCGRSLRAGCDLAAAQLAPAGGRAWALDVSRALRRASPGNRAAQGPAEPYAHGSAE